MISEKPCPKTPVTTHITYNEKEKFKLIGSTEIYELIKTDLQSAVSSNECRDRLCRAVQSQFKQRRKYLLLHYTAAGDARYIRRNTDNLSLFETAESVRKRVTFTTANNLCGKFLDPFSTNYDAGNDFPVLRFADVLLMASEVVNELTPTPADETLTSLNENQRWYDIICKEPPTADGG
jgi:hypothetical protein